MPSLFDTLDLHGLLEVVRPRFRRVLIGNGGIAPEAAEKLVATDSLDLIAFGRPFLANPDLPEPIRQGGPYNEPRNIGWYGGTAEGYTDYPTLPAQAAA